MWQTLLVLGIWTFGAISSENIPCPWDASDLEKWSDDGTWAPGTKPAANESVVIPTGKKILLDAPIPRFLTLIINGTLVWGDVDGIKLETSYIVVHGELHIGSEECNFEKTADIFLYGRSNSEEVHPTFGRKFIGVNHGGKLEIHGKQKRSWTKLVSTVTPGCEPLYHTGGQKLKNQPSIWMNIWNADGTSLDFFLYRVDETRAEASIANIVKKIRNAPDGSVVGLAVYLSIGTFSEPYNELYQAVEGLGGSQIRHVGEDEPYLLFAEKGKPETTLEKHMNRSADSNRRLQVAATFLHGDLAFQGSSYSDTVLDKHAIGFRVITWNDAFPKLSFLHDVTSWQPEDEVVVASTDYDWRQYEVKVIVPCHDCQANQIRVFDRFMYTHFGEVTYGVDERGEVGLLSRNIRIEAELQKQCYSYNDHEKYLCSLFKRDTFGGHIKFLRSSWIRVEGAQLTHMGQQSLLGSYPFHFHLCDEVAGQYLRNNVVRDSNSRCLTIHCTHYLDVRDNVCLNHLGHGIFLEDSVEQNNTIHHNLVIGTTYGTLLFTDMNADWCKKQRKFCGHLASYWITHPLNTFTDNVAAGSDGDGMAFLFADRPIGPSLQRMKDLGLYKEYSTRYTKIGEFSRNTMHSNTKNGLWFDTRISSGEQEGRKFFPENALLGMGMYNPRYRADPNGELVMSVLSQLTMYKNEERNSWIRCGNIMVVNSTFADSPVSYVGAHTVDGTYCDLRHSIFIGETDNKGEPFTYTFSGKHFNDVPKRNRPRQTFDRSIARGKPDLMISGIQWYQGPAYVENCFFDKFVNWYYNDSFIEEWGIRPLRPMTAITFHPANHYPMVPRNAVSNLKFGYCDGVNNSFRVMDGNSSTPWWLVMDGTENIIFKDIDGSVTGTKDTYIVQDRPFFTGPKCLRKPDWGLAVCPYKYFWLILRGKTGVLKSKYKGKTPVLLRRDGSPEDVYTQTGITANKYNLLAFESYTIFFNSTVGSAPRDLQMKTRFGLEKNQVVRFAVCLPKSTNSFTITSKYPKLNPRKKLLPIWVDSLELLDQDDTMKAFYWDKANGYLYFKMKSPYSLEGPTQECPGEVCLEINIKRNDGDDEPAVCDSPVTPYSVLQDDIKTVEKPTCTGPDSPEGLGAPIESGFEPPSPSTETCA